MISSVTVMFLVRTILLPSTRSTTWLSFFIVFFCFSPALPPPPWSNVALLAAVVNFERLALDGAEAGATVETFVCCWLFAAAAVDEALLSAVERLERLRLPLLDGAAVVMLSVSLVTFPGFVAL